MNKSLKTLLGFTEVESDIWDNLSQPMCVSDLARITQIPRTTLYTSLDSLKLRGFIKIKKEGRVSTISPLSATDIQKRISQEFSQISESGEYSVKLNEDSGFTIIHGMEKLVEVWNVIVDKYPKQRICAFQPTKSLLTLVKKHKEGYFIPVNEKIKRNGVIFETVTREDGIPAYLDLYKGNPEVQREILKSLIGRSTDSVFVKNDYLNTNSDLVITPRSAYLLNWESEIGIEINNKDMIDLLKELFTLARGYGRKVDLTKYLTGILERIS